MIYANKLRSFNPVLLEGYAEAIYLFAKFLQENNIELHLPAVLTSAQTLFDHQRTVIEKQFDTRVFNRYGTREFSGIAHECEKHEGLHINAENLIVEIINNGQKVKPGEVGEIIITDLNNYVVPFIRYHVGDVAVQSGKKCPCGRGLPVISRVEGRLQSVIVGANGNYIIGGFFPHLLKDYKSINQFQVFQPDHKSIVLRIVKGDEFISSELDKAINKIRQYVGEDMKIEIEYVESIPLSESGKQQHTISKVSVPFTKQQGE
jgi:phenylacetate-CoA ligase